MRDREEQFLRLLRENEARLSHVCRAYAQDPDDQRDLHQEILVQIWRSLPGFRGEARASTWLYRVALNTALAHRRRHPGGRTAPLPAHEQWRDRAPLPDESLEAEQRLERLHAAIGRLDDLDRALVTLYLDDCSYREMAEVLGISESNVGVKLHRIRKRLATLLGERAA